MPQDGEVRVNKLDPNRKAVFTNGQWYEVGGPGKPMTGPALNAENTDTQAIQGLTGINANLNKYTGQIDQGELKLGPVANPVNQFKNWAGMSDPRSRDYASFRAGLEKMRNDSLRLNKGVQTEGDAVRAWNELVSNLNDAALVKQRLSEIGQLNQQALQYHKRAVVSRRASQGASMIDPSQFEVAPNAFAPAAPRSPPRGAVAPNKTGASHLTDAQLKAVLGF